MLLSVCYYGYVSTGVYYRYVIMGVLLRVCYYGYVIMVVLLRVWCVVMRMLLQVCY